MVHEHLFPHLMDEVNEPLLIARLEELDAKLPSLLAPHHHLREYVRLAHVSAHTAPGAKDVPVVAGGTQRDLRFLSHANTAICRELGKDILNDEDKASNPSSLSYILVRI